MFQQFNDEHKTYVDTARVQSINTLDDDPWHYIILSLEGLITTLVYKSCVMRDRDLKNLLRIGV